MKFIYLSLLAVLFSAWAFPAYAHESRTYQIGGATYAFVVGSLGEPVVVDDKSGLDLSITRNGAPFIGAEEMLQVEIGIGEERKVFDIGTVYGAAGKYKTTTFYTRIEPLSYRLFGTIENHPLDISFTCAPSGHQMHSVEDATRVPVAEGIVQILKKGAFGCVAEKSEYEFPAATSDQYSALMSVRLALALALVALAFSLAGLFYARGRRAEGFISEGYTSAMNRTHILYALAIVALVLVLYSLYAFGMPNTESTKEVSHGAHPMMEIEKGKPIPTVSIEAFKDSKDGYNLHLKTENFTFTPETVGGKAIANTGHAHLYVNGTKVARVYGAWFNIGQALLVEGDNTVMVTLNADDHSEWARDGKHISAEMIIKR